MSRDTLLNDPDVMLLCKHSPRQIDFVSLVHNFTPEKRFKVDLSEFHKGYRLVPFAADTYGVYESANHETFTESDGTLNTVYEGNTHELGSPLMIVKFNKDVYLSAKEKWSQYWTWKRERNVVRNALEEQFGYDCYTDDTEFLTNDGWKKFDEVSETDTLATFNPLSHKVEYQTPRERIEGTFTGNLYHFTGQHVDVCVTPNHKMYIREFSRTLDKHVSDWSFVDAAFVPECFDTLHTIVPKKARQNLPKGFTKAILDYIPLHSYLRVLGWYISDGSCSFQPNGCVSCVSISQSKPQSRLTQNLTRQRKLNKIKCTEKVYEAKGIANFPEKRWFFDQKLSTMIYEDCGHGSHQKRIPQWCFELTQREMNILLTCLLQGDGTKKNHQEETYVYYTINAALADDVQRLAFLCGFETSKWGPYYSSTLFDDNLEMYQVHINKKASNTKRTYRSNNNIQTIPVVNQRIVCFMTSNHTLVTRRNGKIALHSNSKHAMHLVRLLRMGVEALTEGKIIVRRPDAKELLEIRAGSWTYEQVVEYAEKMDVMVREQLYPTTSLPKKPNYKLAAQLTIEVQDMMWNRTIRTMSEEEKFLIVGNQQYRITD